MENYISSAEVYYKAVEEYKIEVNNVIERMISNNERLVFAIVAEKSGVTRFVVRQYPELRNYILQRMVYYKEIQVINQKIDRAVNSLIKSNKSLSFMAIINKCKFDTDIIYKSDFIKNRIRTVLSENMNR